MDDGATSDIVGSAEFDDDCDLGAADGAATAALKESGAAEVLVLGVAVDDEPLLPATVIVIGGLMGPAAAEPVVEAGAEDDAIGTDCDCCVPS